MLADHERCAFGRGWEARRRGESLTANPFSTSTKWGEFYWGCWCDGWHQFHQGNMYAPVR